MSEFIVPMKHENGDGIFVCVGFAGLNGMPYDVLELSIDGVNFYSVPVNINEPFYSYPYSFPADYEDKVFTIFGRVKQEDAERTMETRIVSKKCKSNNAVFLMDAESSSQTISRGGGIASQPSGPVPVRRDIRG